MNPVLFNIGPLEIRYYGILFALAILVSYFIIIKIAKEKNIPRSIIEELIIYITISIVIGARLFEVLFYSPSYYFNNPIKIFHIWEGGLASHGAILLAIITLYIYTKKKKLNFYEIADILIIPAALGAAFIRIGNFINSELVGKITSVPWAVKFDNYEGLRHPVQIYQAITNTITFFILYPLRNKALKPGTIFWLFLLLFSIFRFITEFFKDLPLDYGLHLYGLDLAQYISIILIPVSAIFLYRLYYK